ncbi:hypothetical protein R9X47_21710 [Wukongibacter baidiensis]|uniref:hypothetical protein n=1 Tax=Wukongibacter baidiensis TaxID=1723361 RepID=UPI003D7FF07B
MIKYEDIEDDDKKLQSKLKDEYIKLSELSLHYSTDLPQDIEHEIEKINDQRVLQYHLNKQIDEKRFCYKIENRKITIWEA